METNVQLTEAEQSITSEDQIAIVLSNPENAEKYPNIFAVAKQKGLVNEPSEDPTLKYIQTRYGNSYTKAEDFFNEVDSLISKGSTNIFDDMPAPLANAVMRAKEGKDWKQELTSDKLIDYDKSYTDRDLLNIYFPGVYSEEDFSDDTKKDILEKSKRQAKSLHDTAKMTEENKKLLSKRNQDQKVAYFNETVEKAIDKAKKLNPYLKPEQIARLKADLTSGNFQSFFFDKKGGLSEDAAVNLVPHIFGEDYLKAVTRPIAEKSNDALIDILNRGTQAREYSRRPNVEEKKPAIKAFEDNKSPYRIPTTQLK